MLTLNITLDERVYRLLEEAYMDNEYTDLSEYVNDVLYDALIHRGK